MKIAVIGIDIPLGKHNLPDERVGKLKNIFHPAKLVYVQINFEDHTHIKDTDGIICEVKSKLDLILADLEIIENRLNAGQDKELFLRLKDALEKEIMLNEVPLNEEEIKMLLSLNLVTLKPVVLVDKENMPAHPDLIRNVYAGCGMICFFTGYEKEVHAWPIRKGSTALEAAGTIHSDIQRGFIKAEVVGYEDLIKCGGTNQARNNGLLRLEDKGYIVKDGDLIHIRFNV